MSASPGTLRQEGSKGSTPTGNLELELRTLRSPCEEEEECPEEDRPRAAAICGQACCWEDEGVPLWPLPCAGSHGRHGYLPGVGAGEGGVRSLEGWSRFKILF